VPPDLTVRRRRFPGAAVVLAVGALLVTAGSAGAITYPSPTDSAESPPPPSQPTRANGDTKHTTRLYGKSAFQEAVSVTQLVYPADGATGEDTSFPDDRPRALTLLTPDDPLTAITATPLIHFPDNAPVLYVTANGIPKITRDEIERLKPVGLGRPCSSLASSPRRSPQATPPRSQTRSTSSTARSRTPTRASRS
jgi:hypothetical protein